MNSRYRGFTLIEVLIAAVILFTAIALTAEIYNSSAKFSSKAIGSTNYSQYASIAITSIKSDLRYEFKNESLAESYVGKLTVGGIEFVWNASKLSEISHYNNIASDEVPKAKFGRYLVSVDLNKLNKNFQFEVLLWP
ncbi:prepilin-type N-terminal cleavage/methylation domain-containing protein [Pseudoalteromonas sp. JC3]|uniref:prepilin-type N-terminal cleavage/methylation domain-containing protein n=1 Tax=Pseudoalteromonas sp. JC3 TaxID=2810196 RepID=UPI0019D06197|nr:prepilin-type N-terminal cleavage/methylation domain-containing protein [Pseudoalteromonas sp. JC3]MBR8842492.1 prepilin-type N-terminal cleavage/methylation domain-containing protein [Pseudoalteromonas sp. JC3]WJE09390.1 prepilin-type N-terminal cleavage/methylation domain-containing protein [Pseudoalteromonas sp. JC3]